MLTNLKLNPEYAFGLPAAHGDKGYGYKLQWHDAGIPFDHDMAIYLLGRIRPFVAEKEMADSGGWVIANYKRFLPFLPPSDEPESCRSYPRGIY